MASEYFLFWSELRSVLGFIFHPSHPPYMLRSVFLLRQLRLWHCSDEHLRASLRNQCVERGSICAWVGPGSALSHSTARLEGFHVGVASNRHGRLLWGLKLDFAFSFVIHNLQYLLSTFSRTGVSAIKTCQKCNKTSYTAIQVQPESFVNSGSAELVILVNWIDGDSCNY